MALRRPRRAEARLGAVRRAADADRRRGRKLRRGVASDRRRRAGEAHADRARRKARRRGCSCSTLPRFTAASSWTSASKPMRISSCSRRTSATASRPTKIVTNVKHVGERGRSRQTVRSVLGGKAVGSYLGKVEVARGAQQTDGEQSVKAMLLDRGATANCKPELEIFADDVKCAHGASVGELDRDADVLRAIARARSGERTRAAARRFRHGPVGRCRRRGAARRDLHRRARRIAEGRDDRARPPHPEQRARRPRANSRRSRTGIISTAPRPRRSRRR